MSKPNFDQVLAAIVYATNNGIEIPFDVSRLTKKDLRPKTPDVNLDDIITVETPAAPATTPNVANRQAWPKTQGPENGPHPWTVEQARKFTQHVSYPRDYTAILFESARGVLTYQEIGDLFNFTGPTVNAIALKHGIARHQNPRIHKGKTSRTRNVS